MNDCQRNIEYGSFGSILGFWSSGVLLFAMLTGTLPFPQEALGDMLKAIARGRFRIPDECMFIKIDRFTGARLSDDATGDNVVAECFREGEEPLFGITFDGGFAMGANLPLVEEVGSATGREVTTSTGKKAVVGPKANFGTLSSGGLY